MVSSGATASATTSAAAVTILTSTTDCKRTTIINEGSVAGFFSLDGGGSWLRLPAASAATAPIAITVETDPNPVTLQIKNGTGGNLGGIFAWAV